MSAGAINNNLMAANVANNLNYHYSRLAISTQRLSTGLRVNSAADDAAGLAIRELMRSDIAAARQGIRNANDAVSLLQVADGALAVIDEKLIRMKELAEQAATGTYDSTQRLMIDSEYKAMADEIDRIARATDFNGIKLLDGSLTGKHNGAGLNSTGALKIHFGTANDSAEDYYYVEIGDCTVSGLGLCTAGGTPIVIREKFEVMEETHIKYEPKQEYTFYYDPVTGNRYQTDGNSFFTSTYNPGGTRLDWVTDKEIIERLQTQQIVKKTNLVYAVFGDPQTGREYFTKDGGKTFTSDPYDVENKTLNPGVSADKAILDRLTASSKTVSVQTSWKEFKTPDEKLYYSCDGGLTYSPVPNNPSQQMIVSSDPANRELVASLQPSLEGYKRSYLKFIDYDIYQDPHTRQLYYQFTENGETRYAADKLDPYNTLLMPDKDGDIIKRLEPVVDDIQAVWSYEVYLDPKTNMNLYTIDGGKTFVQDISDPFNITNVNPGDLLPVVATAAGMIQCDVFEDPVTAKRYYTIDKGASYFDDLSDMENSVLDKTDPGYNSFVATLKKMDTVAYIRPILERYYDDITQTYYYTPDSGLTFWRTATDNTIALDSSNPQDKLIIARLSPVIEKTQHYSTYLTYLDPDTNTKYYTPWRGNKEIFLTNVNDPLNIALDKTRPDDSLIIDRLVPVIDKTQGNARLEFPGEALIYYDERANNTYFSWDGGLTFSRTDLPTKPSDFLNPDTEYGKNVIDRLKPLIATQRVVKYVERVVPGQGRGLTISTQQAAQMALVAIDNAIVSKDRIRAHLGALQNRLENTVANLGIQAENLQTAESRISDTDVAREMTMFVRNQILTQSAVAMLGQANSFPHMMARLLNA